MMDQWNRYDEKPDFDQYVKDTLKMDKEESGWQDFDFSLENMKSIHEKLFKQKFNEHDQTFFHKIVNPTLQTTSIIDILRQKEFSRCIYVKKVVDYINSGKIYLLFLVLPMQ